LDTHPKTEGFACGEEYFEAGISGMVTAVDCSRDVGSRVCGREFGLE
jgi:hypothetical protein